MSNESHREPARPGTALPEQIARTRRFSAGVPGQFTVTPDGSAVLFLRSRAGDDPAACLWLHDPGTGAERLLADPAALDAAPGTGIAGYALDGQGTLAAFTLGGGLWTVPLAGGPPRRLPAAARAAGPQPDPAGRRIAYACGGELRLTGADGDGDRALLTPEGPDVRYGHAPHTGATSAEGTARGHWWAPDGSRLLVARADGSAVALWYLSDPSDPARPPRSLRYAPAGTANPDVSLLVAGLDGSRVPVRWDRAAFEYLIAAGWDARGPWAAVETRDQRTTHVLDIDPGTGQTTVLAEQRDACWVQPVPGLPARAGSGTLVGHADVAGTRHLTVGGRPVTPDGLQLAAVLGADGEEVLFTASGEPEELHLWSYASGELRQLSSGLAIHSGARRGGTTVHVTRGAARPGGEVTVTRGAGPGVPVRSLAEPPVLDLLGPVLEDQVTAVREAAARVPDLDVSRVGIRGWSFGGTLAAWAVLRRPDIFHAAVAGAGVTDQLLYGARWRERFLGHPAEFPERYAAFSLVDAAPGLTRPLLLMHGLLDDNVHPANTLRLSQALLAAGRPHEVLLLPGEGHRAIGGPLTPMLLARQAEFLQRHLGAAEPPGENT